MDCQPCNALVVTFLHDLVLPLIGLIRVPNRPVTYCYSLTWSWALLSLSLLSSLFQRYTRVAHSLPLGGCMDILAAVVSADNLCFFSLIKASKSTITIEPYLLTYPIISLRGRSFNMDLHTTTGPWTSGQLTSCSLMSRYEAKNTVICPPPLIFTSTSLHLHSVLNWLMQPIGSPL